MHVDSDEGVLRIAFDRPAALNAVTKEIAAELADTIEDASPEEYDAIVLTGEGDAFSAGGDATFSCAFVRIGLIPDTGGTFMLPHIIGLRAAKRLAFTGEFFDAERAADLDLINEAVPPEDLDDRVDETLERLRGRPTEIIGLMKGAMHENMARHWSEALDHENLLQVQARTSDAHAEGVAAFLEDREPEFDT